MTRIPSTGDERAARKRVWPAAAVIVLVLAVGAALYFGGVIPRKGQAARRQHEQLLELGAALKQYASAHDNALPEQVPPGASGAAAGTTYRAVTQSGERLRYEPLGDRVIAWTEPDAQGRRAVLLNSLDEVVRVPDASLNLAEQWRTDAGPLNRVRIPTSEGEGEEGEEEAVEPEPATLPATTGAGDGRG